MTGNALLRLLTLIVLLVAAACAVITFGTPDPSKLRFLVGQNAYAPAVFLLLHIPASLLFLPRTVIGIAAGIVFGPWLGFWLALLGAVIGGAVGFMVARYLNNGVIQIDPNSPMSSAISRAAQRGWISVALFRLIPGIHHSLANYLLGVAPISLPSFLLGSAIAQVPSTALYMYAAHHSEALLRDGFAAGWWSLVSVGICALLALFLVLNRLRRSDNQARHNDSRVGER